MRFPTATLPLFVALAAATTATGQDVSSPPSIDTYIQHSSLCTDNLCGANYFWDADTSFNTQTRVDCQRAAQALVLFDLSGLGPYSSIQSATLRLFALEENEYDTNVFHVSRLIEDWATTDVNWCDRTSNQLWAIPGGTASSVDRSSISIPRKGPDTGMGATGPYYEWFEWDVTAIVTAWLQGGAPNYGFLVHQEPWAGHGRNQSLSFASREHPDSSLAPQLVVVGSVVSAEPSHPTAATLSLQTHPNPTQSEVHLVLEMPSPDLVEVEILDVTGRRVRSLGTHRFGEGPHSLLWDAADDQGATVGAGVYFLVARTRDGWTSRRVVQLR